MISHVAIGSISLYQRWLSPRKGFCCAHRVLHRGPSCSEFMKQRCRERGLLAALRELRLRLLECREAAQAIRQRRVMMAMNAGEGEIPAIAGESTRTAGEVEGTTKPKSGSSSCGPDPSFCAALDCGIAGCDIAEACGGVAACA